MRRVKAILATILLAELAVLAAGCSGIGTTPQQNLFTVGRVIDSDARMLNDDVMLATQTNRPWRGSYYPMK
jgi:hypothetical protein